MQNQMRALEIDKYGTAAEALRIKSNAAAPSPAADQILIEVKAVSVNPVDCAIRRGYGREVFRNSAGAGPTGFPMALGRDAAGIIDSVGSNVESFRAGDAVWTAPTNPTSADFIAVAASEAALMPKGVTFVQAASLPFVAMTVWNTLVNQAGLSPRSFPGRRVLVTRGAGGVGSFAIQLIKAWGGYVASVCSARNVEFVRSLGADLVVDYAQQPAPVELRDFDLVLDSSFDKEKQLLDLLKVYAGATYVTITSPKVRLADEFGLKVGSQKADELLASRRAEQKVLGRHYHWGFMRPDGEALAEVARLVESGQVKPRVDRIYPLERIADAHEYCESGQAQGKIVIDMTL
jgi:reticulon-4-interacting protein 1, mitochondrial